jgi:hypothetical protein
MAWLLSVLLMVPFFTACSGGSQSNNSVLHHLLMIPGLRVERRIIRLTVMHLKLRRRDCQILRKWRFWRELPPFTISIPSIRTIRNRVLKGSITFPKRACLLPRCPESGALGNASTRRNSSTRVGSPKVSRFPRL